MCQPPLKYMNQDAEEKLPLNSSFKMSIHHIQRGMINIRRQMSEIENTMIYGLVAFLNLGRRFMVLFRLRYNNI